MEGKGYNTYGSFYEIGTYSSNRSVCSIVTERHVLKNTTPKLGPEEKATGPGLYSRAFQIRSRPSTDHAKSRGSIGFRTASCTGRTRWAWRTPS